MIVWPTSSTKLVCPPKDKPQAPVTGVDEAPVIPDLLFCPFFQGKESDHSDQCCRQHLVCNTLFSVSKKQSPFVLQFAKASRSPTSAEQALKLIARTTALNRPTLPSVHPSAPSGASSNSPLGPSHSFSGKCACRAWHCLLLHLSLLLPRLD